MKKILSVFGTRPEAIKMAPLVKEIQKNPELESVVCLSGQHAEMLTQVMTFFQMEAQYNLEVMNGCPGLTQIYARVLSGLDEILDKEKPDLILVHGDTATTAAAAMAAFLKKIPVGHVEAGLRTGDIYSPWPEEFNRKVAGMVTHLHFAPTAKSKENLLKEGVSESDISVCGNTVIDALFLTLEKLSNDEGFVTEFYKKYPFVSDEHLSGKRRLILVTGHRRENFGEGMDRMCNSLLELSQEENVDIVFPVHLNPRVKGPVFEILGDRENIHLTDPLEYSDFIYMMKHSYFVVTDSGGVQEEAPSLGKPVIVTRDVTERPEAVEAGTVKLVGTDSEKILSTSRELLRDSEAYMKTSRTHNPYGDGKACQRIVSQILSRL